MGGQSGNNSKSLTSKSKSKGEEGVKNNGRGVVLCWQEEEEGRRNPGKDRLRPPPRWGKEIETPGG